MFYKKIKSKGLAHFSYFIGDENEAAVIDPRRDIDIYLEEAEKEGAEIKYIFETHRNEDYIIGSKALASVTGAEILHADGELDYKYGKEVEQDKKYKLGRLSIEALHTPGHTKGSHSYILNDYDDQPWMIFTGDILFANDVGRIDFYGEENIPEIAALLYDSLYNKIMPLGDGVIVCPAHGAGSVCGSQIADREMTTIGIEKKSNPYLQYQSKAEFVSEVGEMEAKPQYFKAMEAANLAAPARTDLPFVKALKANIFEEKAAQKDHVVIDIRSESDFASAHVPSALFLRDNILASFIGWFIATDKKILLVSDGSYPEETIRTLYRMGYENIEGYLYRGMLSWNMAAKESSSVTTANISGFCNFIKDKNKDQYLLLDIRKEEEKEEEGYLESAVEIPLNDLQADLNNYLAKLDSKKDIFIFCGSGIRSMTAASLINAKLEAEVKVVLGGLTAWAESKCILKIKK
ncbi:MAG: MBL fold metallo-hydrolase [Halanaerobium sp. MSAO_Bac5]|nr:MAG: MBL fold metallo-hydrolase [Halanaerobium sp. MSAO_Bac5]